MIFNSLSYVVLLILVIGLYWLLPKRPRLILVFSSSLIFYAFWRIEFLPLLLFSTFFDWWIAKRMHVVSDKFRFRLLLLSLIVNIGLLFYFKYLIFFLDNAIGIANFFGASVDQVGLNIVLPLGISFYTFQTISYTVDVYRKHIPPERSFLLFGCYVTFFPQLIAGPILRAGEIIRQFKIRPAFSMDHLFVGLRRILYGLFLKVVLADNLSPLVDDGFAMPVGSMSAFDVWTLAFLFGFQIYFDFSAYSHIALGSARMMGLKFPENFNFPYLAKSPKDFWQRWHISLSSWIRDYLYLPLSGIKVLNRSTGGIEVVSRSLQSNRALFLTWGIMGLWHGANWNFVLWGVFHAFVIYTYRLLNRLLTKKALNVPAFFGWLFTLPVMMLAWIPFRAESVDITFDMWSKVLNPLAYGWLGMRENTYLVAAIVLAGIIIASIYSKLTIKHERFLRVTLHLLEAIKIAIMTSLVIIFFRPINQFIYFQF